MILAPPGRRVPPVQIADAVELWARSNGRGHGTLKWADGAGCWYVEFPLKDGDPRMEGWREGRLKIKPTEKVFLQRRTESGHLEPMDLEQMGVSGVISLLDEGNLLSGRGRYDGLQDAIRAADEANARLRARMYRESVENARLRSRDEYRWVKGDPLVPVSDTPTSEE